MAVGGGVLRHRRASPSHDGMRRRRLNGFFISAFVVDVDGGAWLTPAVTGAAAAATDGRWLLRRRRRPAAAGRSRGPCGSVITRSNGRSGRATLPSLSSQRTSLRKARYGAASAAAAVLHGDLCSAREKGIVD